MEKRRKNASSEQISDYDSEMGIVTDDEIKKVKNGSSSLFLSFVAILCVIFVIYSLYAKKDHNISFTSLNIPSISEDTVISIKNIIHKTESTIVDGMKDIQFNHAHSIVPELTKVKEVTEDERQKNVDIILDQLRQIKASGKAIEVDPEARILVHSVQDELRQLITHRYGEGPYFIEMKLKFPKSMPDFDVEGEDGEIYIQLAPIDLVPYSTYYFLELANNWQGGAFHRRAGHVLQAMVYKARRFKPLAFQEYHPDFPHRVLTMGYAGRPGGPEFYISTQDNVENHGPGSQGSKTEADSCFGKIIIGQQVVERMKKQPGAKMPMGFISEDANMIQIPSLRILKQNELPEL